MAKTLVLFDLDGTLTRRDSMYSFFRYSLHLSEYLAGWMFLLVKVVQSIFLGNFSISKSKEQLLRFWLKRKTREEWEAEAEAFAIRSNPLIFKKKTYSSLKKYSKMGHRVVVVTASLDLWVLPLLKEEGVEVLATRSNWNEQRWEGFEGANCKGVEKVRRIHETLSLSDYSRIIAYGNSSGDAPMLALANEPHWV